jgi:hypothetical protein
MDFLGSPVSSVNKTDRHDINEILLKVASNTIIPTSIFNKRARAKIDRNTTAKITCCNQKPEVFFPITGYRKSFRHFELCAQIKIASAPKQYLKVCSYLFVIYYLVDIFGSF